MGKCLSTDSGHSPCELKEYGNMFDMNSTDTLGKYCTNFIIPISISVDVNIPIHFTTPVLIFPRFYVLHLLYVVYL